MDLGLDLARHVGRYRQVLDVTAKVLDVTAKYLALMARTRS